MVDLYGDEFANLNEPFRFYGGNKISLRFDLYPYVPKVDTSHKFQAKIDYNNYYLNKYQKRQSSAHLYNHQSKCMYTLLKYFFVYFLYFCAF